MTEMPEIAGRSPLPVDVEAGRSYWWCACGRSKTQPFCDGSHKGTSFSPQVIKLEQPQTLWLCACKKTAKAPNCDGSHKNP